MAGSRPNFLTWNGRGKTGGFWGISFLVVECEVLEILPNDVLLLIKSVSLLLRIPETFFKMAVEQVGYAIETPLDQVTLEALLTTYGDFSYKYLETSRPFLYSSTSLPHFIVTRVTFGHSPL